MAGSGWPDSGETRVPLATVASIPESEWFRAIANSAPVLLWVSDATSGCVYFNDRWLVFRGRSLEQELGDGWAEGVHPDDLDRCLEIYRTHFEAHAPFEMEYRLRRYDGAYRWVLDTGTPRYADEEFAGFIGSCIDVTERHEAEQALRESERRTAVSEELYHALAETMPALVLTTSATGEVQYCNRQLVEYCGRDVEGLRGSRWLELIHPDDVRDGRAAWVRRTQVVRPFAAEYRIRRADGRYRWHLTHTAPLRDSSGQLQAWVGVSLDVHDRHQSEDEARRAAVDLQRAGAAKDEFLGLVSHELRTPITTIFGNAQVLRRLSEQLDRETIAAAMSDIEQEAIRLQQLVDNMFVLARIEAGESIPMEPILLSRIVTKAVSEHLARYPERAIVIQDDAGAAPVRGEAAYVEQTLRNLLSNAEKYSPSERPLTVAIDRSDEQAAVRVLDHGIGITVDESAHLFEAFYRSPRASDSAPGAGIGLAVCKRLVEAQGGQIWARPREGGGTEVGFTLPFEPEVTA